MARSMRSTRWRCCRRDEAATRGRLSPARFDDLIPLRRVNGDAAPCPPMMPTTSSPKSCAASCRATRSTRTTRRSPSSTSCRARPAMPWCCRRRRRATSSTFLPTISPHVIKVAQKIAKVSVEVFGADGITIQQFNESAGGQVVFHLHVHVIPRKAGVRDETAGEREGSAGRARRSGQTAGRGVAVSVWLRFSLAGSAARQVKVRRRARRG